MRPAVLDIVGLCKRLGGRDVLAGFSLQVHTGEIVGLLGANGCGKSTVLNTVGQLLRPDAGEVRVLGQALGPHSRAHVALCAQTPALYPDLLPAENLDFQARLYGLDAGRRRARVAELMQSFGLQAEASTRAGRLSGGWRQRLHVAVALVPAPALLLLDEPTAALDSAARQDFSALLRGLRHSGTAVLLTTHVLPEAQSVCDRVALMQGGRVAACGTVPELLASVPARAVAEVHSATPSAVLQRARDLGWSVLNATPGLRLGLPTAMDLRAVMQALDGLPVSAARVRAVRLEDAVHSLTAAP
jgi:ABC-2 type transport system ATP-binding protein